jgi:hypothetical protein
VRRRLAAAAAILRSSVPVATIFWVLVDKEVNVLGRYGSELVYVTFELPIYCIVKYMESESS